MEGCKLYCNIEKIWTQVESFEEAFLFLGQKEHVISFVGAGGKTTLMYALAEQFQSQKYRTLVTTTTHIRMPKTEMYAENREELLLLWQNNRFGVVGEKTTQEKLKMLSIKQLDGYMKEADATLIEADGAKELACKVPNATEPVILAESDIVIGVVGIRVIGKPISEVCFRAELAQKLLGVGPEHILTSDDLVTILLSEEGTHKNVGSREYYVVLNQCDSLKELAIAKKIGLQLREKGIERVIATSFSKK